MKLFVSRKKDFDLALFVFRSVLILLIFLAGGLFYANNWQPFRFIDKAFDATSTLVEEQTQVRPAALLEKLRNDTKGVVRHDKDQAYEGLTIVQGTLPGGPQLRLIDMEGQEIHRWPVDFFSIWPEPLHIEEKYRPKSVFNYHTQGMVVLPDASVIVNINEKGAAKLDKCGNVEWTIDHKAHHSITPIADGGFWIPSHRLVQDIPEHLIFPGITREKLIDKPPGEFHEYENLVLRVDAAGNVIKSFSVLQSIYDAGFESAIANTMRFKPGDPTHVNDIDVVTEPLADKLDSVNAGDILVSIRQMSMLVIMDEQTGTIKWHFVGPWVGHHDPDITIDGNIVVYNNSNPRLAFNRTPGSNLIELEPATGKTRIIYPLEGQQGFYSSILGSHSLLPNGNRLIAESRAGRVFEINPEGEIVWDFVIPYDEAYASLIAYAERVDLDFFEVDHWRCE